MCACIRLYHLGHFPGQARRQNRSSRRHCAVVTIEPRLSSSVRGGVCNSARMRPVRWPRWPSDHLLPIQSWLLAVEGFVAQGNDSSGAILPPILYCTISSLCHVFPLVQRLRVTHCLSKFLDSQLIITLASEGRYTHGNVPQGHIGHRASPYSLVRIVSCDRPS